MNVKCSFCQTPYTLSRVQMLDALQEMDAHKLTHYDAHCPRCRRATRVERKRMEIFFPNWREALKQFDAEMKAHPQHEAPRLDNARRELPAHETAAPAPAESKPAAKPVKEKSAAKAKTPAKSKAKPAAKKKK